MPADDRGARLGHRVRAAAQDLAQHVRPERLERKATRFSALTGSPPIAYTSESAFVAAIRPNAYGSSTIGVKKSTVCTIASDSVSWTTPASSAVSVATSTRGSVGRASPATIGRRSAADSLQPQPAP